jgi:hypothetical protein
VTHREHASCFHYGGKDEDRPREKLYTSVSLIEWLHEQERMVQQSVEEDVPFKCTTIREWVDIHAL